MSRWWLWLLLGVLAAAELLLAQGSPLGAAIYAAMLVALPVWGARSPRTTIRNLTAALILLPIIRLLGSIPTSALVPPVVRYLSISAIVVLAVALALRAMDLRWRAIGFTYDRLLPQLAFGCGGLLIGVLAHLITGDSVPQRWDLPLALLIGCGLAIAEELVFHGVLQVALARAGTRAWWLYGALIFAIVHIGSGSAVHVVFVFSVGLLFSAFAWWSGSIIGVIIAHALANVTTLALLPRALAAGDELTAWTIAAGTLLWLVAVLWLLLRTMARPQAAPLRPRSEIRERRLEYNLGYSELAILSGVSMRALVALEHDLDEADLRDIDRVLRVLV